MDLRVVRVRPDLPLRVRVVLLDMRDHPCLYLGQDGVQRLDLLMGVGTLPF